MATFSLIDWSEEEPGDNMQILADVAARERRLMELESENHLMVQENRRLVKQLEEAWAKNNTATPVNSELSSVLAKLTDVLSKRVDELPMKEPEVFTGDIFNFPIWRNSFRVLVEQRCSEFTDRNYYLNKYTGGEARRCIEGLLALNTPAAYDRAVQTLEIRYGDKFRLAKSFRERIDKWPVLKPGDGKALQNLSDFLNQCEASMATLSQLRVLNDPCEQQKILDRLPRFIQDRWLLIVDKCLYDDNGFLDSLDGGLASTVGEYPTFATFCKFIEKQARIACNPLLDRSRTNTVHASCTKPNTLMSNVAKGRSNGQRVTNATTFASASDVGGHVEEQKSSLPTTFTPKYGKCILCVGFHNLDFCEVFKKMDLKDRKDTVKRHGLCLGCLKWGHRVKDCKHKHKCDKCGRLHPTLLHDESYRPIHSDTVETAISHRAAVGDRVNISECLYHSLIVPVFLHHDDEPENNVIVYALLDEQSDACFVTDSVLEKLGVSGEHTLLKLSTVLAEDTVSCERVSGLKVRGLNENFEVALPAVYSRNDIPVKRSQIPRPETVIKWRHLEKVACQLKPHLHDVEVGLLIGMNCPRAIRPMEIVSGNGDHDPYGVKTALGWGVVGMMVQGSKHFSSTTALKTSAPSHFAFTTKAKEVTPLQVREMFNRDFNEAPSQSEGLSLEDKRFLQIVEEGIQHCEDGHFQIPLPFREDQVVLPNNRQAVLSRLGQLKSKMRKNQTFHDDYCQFMSKLIAAGHAERVPEGELSLNNGSVWYIPHHGVYHPHKPSKIRVVFDCAASFHGEALNSHLLRGPDMLSNLTGILMRFRKEPVAFTCDIEGMFLQVIVAPQHRNYLRFLWWDEGDIEKPIVEYRMTVHLFGATSSPGCANFALKATADKFASHYSSETAEFIKSDFYCDDGLKACKEDTKAIQLIEESHDMCSKGGFNLRDYKSNSRVVNESIIVANRAKDLHTLDLNHDHLPVGRTLGLQWNIETDVFLFQTDFKEKQNTRRGILSTISSLYDPLGLVSPFVLKGKQILKDLCTAGAGWDDSLPEETLHLWQSWKDDLGNLSKIEIPRCVKTGLAKIDQVEMHHFSDASLEGYGTCSYVKQKDILGNICTALVMAKSRVTPAKSVTVPRLELTAAVTAVRVSQFLERELKYEAVDHYFYTDSQVVLGYINNESRRFHIYVANRVQEIRDASFPSQWHYIETGVNPADIASRGMSALDLCNSDLWWKGPPFLVSGLPPSQSGTEYTVNDQDPELKKTVLRTGADIVKEDDMVERFEKFSSWFRLKKAVALCLKYVRKLKAKDYTCYTSVNTEDMQEAENRILKIVQRQAFSAEIETLKKSDDGQQRVKKSSSVSSLDPFLDENSLLRVGGRLRRGSMPDSLKHPVLLPKRSHISKLIIAHHHRKVGHAGRGITLNSLRQGYWVVGARTAVTSHILKCVPCRKLRGKPCCQKMSDLPVDRLEAVEPFTFTGVDYFGPFLIKEGRNQVKRWGVLFCCLSCRAIHLETANHLDVDSFINAYRRFTSRRGAIRKLRCDRGTNFVGGRNELLAAFSEMDRAKIRQELLKDECDLVEFDMNFPHASHMGGAWERLIGSARRVLSGLLEENGRHLDDELLRTLFAETECIVNSRPLTVVDTKSADLEPLSPSQILTLKSQVVKPLPGVFVQDDLFCRKRWRRIQFLANQFWERWRTEFLSSLQHRKKWNEPKRNVKLGDVVLIMDNELPRCQWTLGRVSEVFPSKDGLVRKVKLSAKGKIYERPVHKLILLVESTQDE